MTDPPSTVPYSQWVSACQQYAVLSEQYQALKKEVVPYTTYTRLVDDYQTVSLAARGNADLAVQYQKEKMGLEKEKAALLSGIGQWQAECTRLDTENRKLKVLHTATTAENTKLHDQIQAHHAQMKAYRQVDKKHAEAIARQTEEMQAVFIKAKTRVAELELRLAEQTALAKSVVAKLPMPSLVAMS